MRMRRRRPLMGAAMIGGTAYVAHKAGQNSANAQMQEQDQEARLEALEAQQAPAPVAAAPVAAAAAPAGDDMISKLQQLQTLKEQGVLSAEEFEAAKAKVISG